MNVSHVFMENLAIFGLKLLKFERICKGGRWGLARVLCGEDSGLSGCGACAMRGEIELAEILADHAVGVECVADGGHGMLHHCEPAAGKVGGIALVVDRHDLFFE